MLKDIVKVEISRENSTVTRKGFGVLLILGGEAFPEPTAIVKSYATLTEVEADFPVGTINHDMALKAFGGTVSPENILIGYQQRVTIPETAGVATGIADTTIGNWTAIADGSLGVTVDGGTIEVLTALDFSTATDIASVAVILDTAVTGATVTDNAGVLTFTSDTTGIASSVVLSSDVTGTDLYETLITGITSTAGSAEVIAETPTEAIANISVINDDWYALATDLSADTEIFEIATYIQALNKMYFAQAEDPSILLLSSTDDIATQLMEATMSRTALIFESADNYSGSAWAGQYLPFDPGTINWAHKTLGGVTVSKLTSAEKASAQGKLCNTYTTTAGRNTTQFGFTSELGTYIDIIRSIDWLEARIQEGVFGRLAATLKIPYNDAGFTIIASEVEAVLQTAEADGVINPDWTVTVPKLEDIPQADKDARNFAGTEFTATLAGGINTVEIQGYIS